MINPPPKKNPVHKLVWKYTLKTFFKGEKKGKATERMCWLSFATLANSCLPWPNDLWKVIYSKSQKCPDKAEYLATDFFPYPIGYSLKHEINDTSEQTFVEQEMWYEVSLQSGISRQSCVRWEAIQEYETVYFIYIRTQRRYNECGRGHKQ